MGTKFVGDQHHSALQTLMNTVTGSGQSSGSHVVLLEGASGVGKSRIVKEFYEALRVETEDPYWPPLSKWGYVESSDPMRGRKLLAPPTEDFIWTPDALPRFTWWGFECYKDESNDVLDVVAQAGPTITRHAIPAAIALREQTGALARGLRVAIDQVRSALSDSKVDLALEGLSALGVAIPGLSWIVDGAIRGTALVNARNEERRALRSAVDQGAAVDTMHHDQARQYGAAIRATVGNGLPCVLVVEDMHLMGEELALLLTEVLADATQPVLIIGTVWPEGRDRLQFQRWIAGLSEVKVHPVTLPISPLPTATLEGWVRDLAPNTAPRVIQQLVEKYPNQLALRIYLGLKKTIREVCDGALDLTAEDIENLPSSIEGLYKKRWAELPEEVQQALAIASGVLPKRGQLEIINEVVAEAARRAAVDSDDLLRIAHSLSDGASRFEWMTPLRADRQAFKEEILRDIALLNVSDFIGSTRLKLLSQEASAVLELRLCEAVPLDNWSLIADGEDDELMSRWLLGMTDRAEPITAGRAIAALTVSERMAQADRPRLAIENLELYPSWATAFDDADARVWVTRNMTAEWLGDAGRFEDALASFAANAVGSATHLGATHAETIRARRMRSHYLQKAGHLTEAISAADGLLAELRIAPDGHEDSIAILGQNLVGYLGANGDPATAASLYEALIVDATKAGDEDTARKMRRNRASFLEQSGSGTQALAILEELHEEYRSLDDANSQESLQTQMQLAQALPTSDRERALKMARLAVSAGSARWDGNSEIGLSLRGNLANFENDTAEGQLQREAVLRELVQLCVDYEKYLPGDPDGVSWVKNLTSTAAHLAGAYEIGVTHGRSSYQRRIQELGAKDPRTKLSAYSFASNLARMHLHAEIVDVASGVLEGANSADLDIDAKLLTLRALKARALLEVGQRELAHKQAIDLMPLVRTHVRDYVSHVAETLRRSTPPSSAL